MFCHLFPPSPLGDVHVWLEASPVLYWYHLVPPLSFSSWCCSACLSSVFPWLSITCIPVFSLSLVMMALAQYSFKQLLSIILLPVVLSRFVLHRTETLSCRQREQCSCQEQGYCSCPMPEAPCTFLPTLARGTQVWVAFQEEESTLDSLNFFCDLDLVLLLSCHCIGYLVLNVVAFQLPSCVSWWLLCERLSSSSKQDCVALSCCSVQEAEKPREGNKCVA